jgi:ATP-binding cassette, subfamily B, bacterial
MDIGVFSSLWWVVKLQIKTSRAYFIWIIIYSVYYGLSSILAVYIGAQFIASVTAIAFKSGSPTDAYMWLGLLLALEILNALTNILNRLFEKRMQQKMDIVTNEMLFTKMYELSQEQFDDQTFNTKLGRARESLSSMWRVTTELTWTLTSAVRFIVSISAIVLVSPVVGIIIILAIIPVTLVRAKQNNEIEEVYRKVEPFDRVAFRSRWMMIDPNTMPEIRLMNSFRNLLSSWRTNLSKAQDTMFKTEIRQARLDAATRVVEPAVAFGATLYFLRLLISGSLAFDRFLFLRGLIDQANTSASAIAASLQTLHELSINLKNFNDVYKTAPVIKNGSVMVKSPLTIEVKNLCFSYPGIKAQVLKDVSFVINPGCRLALVGENGAGKSTLIKLLLRQYLPTKGTITVNGTDIADVDQESYYSCLSNLSQDFLMINHLSIKDNLLMGLEDTLSDNAIQEATELVDAHTFIQKLPHKYSQRLDSSFDDGSSLSGGQMQRIGVARALLRNGDIMILDEPTSAIDAKAEYMIFNNIYKKHANKTTLIVSHRFSTVRKADKIIVMDQGKITEYGSHEELVKHNGLYKEMFETQAEGYR